MGGVIIVGRIWKHLAEGFFPVIKRVPKSVMSGLSLEG